MAAAEEVPEPLKYQTLALKVSIHCEGCKKKVKKVLHSIEGVYKTDIDIQHQKVVVIGNVSVDTLVKKLVKTGKHAEPWPEPAPPPAAANPPGEATGGGKKKKKNRNKNKNPANTKPVEAAPPAENGGGGGGPIPPPPEKQEHASSCDEASDDEPDKPEGGGSPKKTGAGDAHDGGAGGMAPFAMTPNGKQPIAPAANGNGGGKKKGKKGGNANGNTNTNTNSNGDGAGAISAVVEVNPPDAAMKPAAGNAGPLAVVDAGVYPPAAAMSYPGYYPAVPAGGHVVPPYVMSYNTAHPLRSSAYYHPMIGAAFAAGGGSGGGYFYSTAPVSAAPGSYYMFSEENANACSVM